jgi:mannose-6-phosphate isomerase-like protein (cupin superfamily)
MEQFIKKTWGYELCFANVKDENYCGKILFVEYGKWSSDFKYHYHKKKDETFCVIEGTLQLDYIINGEESRTIYIPTLKTFRIRPFTKHRFTSFTLCGCKFIEASTFDSDEDSYRCYYDPELGIWKEN